MRCSVDHNLLFVDYLRLLGPCKKLIYNYYFKPVAGAIKYCMIAIYYNNTFRCNYGYLSNIYYFHNHAIRRIIFF